jgi:membrane-bound lytic murein transglycosylase F
MTAQPGKRGTAGRDPAKRWQTRLIVIASIVACAVAGWLYWRVTATARRDLDDIRQSGKLRVLLSYDPINYFIYRGAPMGYSYELARSFARYLGVPLEVVVVRDINNQIPMLRNNEGDIVAHLMTVTPEREQLVSFTTPLDSTRQVLVQLKPKGDDSSKLVRTLDQLDGKSVQVHLHSAYFTQLAEIRTLREIDFEIVPADGALSTSELIGKVSNGALDYTVADENIARTHQALFDNIDIRTPVSAAMPLAWAVRNSSPELREALNRWLARAKKSGELAIIRDKYYNRQNRFKKHAIHVFYSNHAGTISTYDKLVRKTAKEIDWDWRLLSALIYEESQFDADALSWSGAMGLMQLMPATGAQFKARNLFDPADNLKAGARYLRALDAEWKEIDDRLTRLKFILASYNVGAGHVRDAQRLASKYGAKPDLWEGNVEKYLSLTSESKYYNDPAAALGYCNGKVAVLYTRNIIDRYQLYREVIPK